MFFQNDGQPLEKLRATFFETMGNVSKIGLRHSLMALLHGVERGAQARDGFTTRCRKERASPQQVYYMV